MRFWIKVQFSAYSLSFSFFPPRKKTQILGPHKIPREGRGGRKWVIKVFAVSIFSEFLNKWFIPGPLCSGANFSFLTLIYLNEYVNECVSILYSTFQFLNSSPGHKLNQISRCVYCISTREYARPSAHPLIHNLFSHLIKNVGEW